LVGLELSKELVSMGLVYRVPLAQVQQELTAGLIAEAEVYEALHVSRELVHD
jgi:hypothetical protein